MRLSGSPLADAGTGPSRQRARSREPCQQRPSGLSTEPGCEPVLAASVRAVARMITPSRQQPINNWFKCALPAESVRLPAAPSGRLAVRRSSSSVSSVPANGVSVSQAALVVAWVARGGGRCRGAVDGGGGAYPRSRVSQWAGQADLGQIATSDQIRAARRERAAGGRWCQAGPGRAVVPGRAASPRALREHVTAARTAMSAGLNAAAGRPLVSVPVPWRLRCRGGPVPRASRPRAARCHLVTAAAAIR